MKRTSLINGIAIMLTIISASCNNTNRQLKTENAMEQEVTKPVLPIATKFVSSPLRNRIKLELNAPVTEVWAMVGHLEHMPEYSTGLHEVDAKYDNSGKCTDYTCYFFPEKEGDPETTHREIIKWYEPNVGLVSTAEEPNVFGLQQALTLITFEENGDKTILSWDIHFNAANEEAVKMNISGFEQALNKNIAQNLVKQFGGRILESYGQIK